MRRFVSYDSKRPVRTWLLGIAHRLGADARRKTSSQRQVLDVVDESLPSEGEGAEDSLPRRGCLLWEAAKAVVENQQ